MEPEEVLKLFDSCWFEHEIFKQLENNLPQSDQESKISCGVLSNNLQIRSLSACCLGDYIKETSSSRSVIIKPKLQKILSEKELAGLSKEVAKEEKAEKQLISLSEQEKAEEIKKRKKKRKELGRSLSALEFEEVKGFMDLGFVFTEQDKSSSLISIIPGLQKWGKAANDEETYKLEAEAEAQVKRPYLSEAWGVLNKGKVCKNKNPLMNWRISSLENEISLKDQLKVWAQTVASTVR
ncbi:hypothetical protein CDL12_08437 [Handroanthus impetiginosus]|uniref:Uncharacterized protein n=1 Tax=Handroanthus impetiginosus TaxID=429701 RepID=A0A2G9HMZ6_9LAMI|nr:hypothetical protein CDL12_08437 [Handroanthus impetiginosus]